MGMGGGGQALAVIIIGNGHRGIKVGKGASFHPPGHPAVGWPLGSGQPELEAPPDTPSAACQEKPGVPQCHGRQRKPSCRLQEAGWKGIHQLPREGTERGTFACCRPVENPQKVRGWHSLGGIPDAHGLGRVQENHASFIYL